MQELLGPAKARNSKSPENVARSASQARAVLADENRLKLLMESVDADPRTVVEVLAVSPLAYYPSLESLPRPCSGQRRHASYITVTSERVSALSWCFLKIGRPDRKPGRAPTPNMAFSCDFLFSCALLLLRGLFRKVHAAMKLKKHEELRDLLSKARAAQAAKATLRKSPRTKRGLIVLGI